MHRFFRAMELMLAALLLGMVLMVFGNVVLRYVFNSGLTVSEELSRYFLVWLTFLGAIVTFKDNAHLGVSSMVERLSRKGKVVCAAISHVLIVACCVLMIWGTAKQHEVNATTFAPVTGMSLIWVHGMGYLTAGMIALLALHKLFRIFSGTVSEAELVGVTEDEASPAHSEARGASR
jgi:TRAP-type C4-dicarboxylate transport system permease small subunit